MSRLMKEPQAREYLGRLSYGSFWRMRKDGLIPEVRVGRSVWFDREDLDALIDRLKNTTLIVGVED